MSVTLAITVGGEDDPDLPYVIFAGLRQVKQQPDLVRVLCNGDDPPRLGRFEKLWMEYHGVKGAWQPGTVAQSRDRLIRSSVTDLVWMLDADTLPEPDCLHHLHTVMDRRPDCDLASARFTEFEVTEHPAPWDRWPGEFSYTRFPYREGLPAPAVRGGCWLVRSLRWAYQKVDLMTRDRGPVDETGTRHGFGGEDLAATVNLNCRVVPQAVTHHMRREMAHWKEPYDLEDDWLREYHHEGHTLWGELDD